MGIDKSYLLGKKTAGSCKFYVRVLYVGRLNAGRGAKSASRQPYSIDPGHRGHQQTVNDNRLMVGCSIRTPRTRIDGLKMECGNLRSNVCFRAITRAPRLQLSISGLK
jgi:hypothetical protein